MSSEVAAARHEDRGRWDAYVERHEHASPYHLFAWKEAVEGAYGHRTWYRMALERGAVVGVLPLVHMKGGLGRGSLVSLPFCDVGGVLADSQAVAEALGADATALAERLGVRGVELREAGSGDCEGAKKVRMVLSLPGTSAALWESFSSKLRSQVRKAEKNGLSFRWGGLGDLEAFYDVFSRNMRDLGSPVHSKRWIRFVVERYGDRCRLGLVQLGDQAVGAGLVLTVGRRASIPWASTLREHNRLAPNMLLYWNVLETLADAGFEAFDFGRSTPGEGTYRFKEQWGARPVPLRWRTLGSGNGAGEALAAPSRTRDLVATLWSRLPLAAANAVGPLIRRRISL